MGRPSPFRSKLAGVHVDHGPGLPAGDLHQVDLAPADGQPVMGERPTEPVGSQPLDAGLLAAPGQHPGHPGDTEVTGVVTTLAQRGIALSVHC